MDYRQALREGEQSINDEGAYLHDSMMTAGQSTSYSTLSNQRSRKKTEFLQAGSVFQTRT